MPRESNPKRHKSESRIEALHDAISQAFQKNQKATALKFLNRLRAEIQRTI